MLDIGGIRHQSRVLVAPMAGVTDRPFRDFCRSFGAHWLVGEMLTSNQALWQSKKSRSRQVCQDEVGPKWIQIAGADPGMMADAAAANEAAGADIIDINMGCPAKKVCNKAAGSALMRDEGLVSEILERVCASVTVPVTLKIRLGWSKQEQNAEAIALIAESAGISLLTIHGRTRACKFQGEVDYDAIGAVKAKVSLPVIANGDIQGAQQAEAVIQRSGVNGVMVGRAALGQPWLISAIDQYLTDGVAAPTPTVAAKFQALEKHLAGLYKHYGPGHGHKIARKHVGWFLQANLVNGYAFSRAFNQLESSEAQVILIQNLAHQLQEELAA